MKFTLWYFDLISRFSSMVNLLEMIIDDNTNDSMAETNRLLRDIQSFESVFLLFFCGQHHVEDIRMDE